MLSSTLAIFETQFMKKFSKIEAELKKKYIAYKKACVLKSFGKFCEHQFFSAGTF